MLVQHLPIQRWLVTVPVFRFCEAIHAGSAFTNTEVAGDSSCFPIL